MGEYRPENAAERSQYGEKEPESQVVLAKYFVYGGDQQRLSGNGLPVIAETPEPFALDQVERDALVSFAVRPTSVRERSGTRLSKHSHASWRFPVARER